MFVSGVICYNLPFPLIKTPITDQTFLIASKADIHCSLDVFPVASEIPDADFVDNTVEFVHIDIAQLPE